MREKTLGTLTITITVPSADPSEVWSLTAQQQLLNATTGGAVGNPVSITPNPMPPLAFSTVEGGFSTTADFPNTAGVTHAFSYTATRTVPTPVTCTSQGFWTTPNSGTEPVVPPNPISFPDSAPALTGATEADTGTSDVLLQFDQQLLDTAAGVPAASRFAITVDGAARTPTAVQVVNDSPPGDALVDVTFDGAALTTGQTVGVTYRQPLVAGQPHLQDLEGNAVANFGPISVPVF
ncbi:MAG TPA: hypothetical protein VFW65_24150 [Pseudonocardiaceae bacterium]|nr:hypothetical protein [Pseudonocardiaceae bacterium]